MSWSRRSLIALALASAGCGFTPVYGPGGVGAGLMGQIEVAPPRDEAGYILVRQLEDRLGLPSAPLYRLDADLRLVEDDLGITRDQEITRIRLRGQVAYRLVELDGGAIVSQGTLENFTSYSAPVLSARRDTTAGNAVSVRAAEEDALQRLMVILADQIVSRLLATAPDWRQ